MAITGNNAGAQVQDYAEKMYQKSEELRILETEISEIEKRTERSKRDLVMMSDRLKEVEKKILACYMELDSAEEKLRKSKKRLNARLREIYVEGRQDDLVKFFNSSDVSDFLVNLDNLIGAARRESEYLDDIELKRRDLREKQGMLIEFKREAAMMTARADGRALETELAGKKKRLAELSGELIAMQLPVTQVPVPTDFNPNRVYNRPDENGFVRTGQVISGYSSWYGNEFHGRNTASGEVFDQYAFTCAHRTLPFGTWLRVTFCGRSVVVKVNDRGPFVEGRILDLSRGAAEALGLTGVQWVDCEIVVPRT